MSHIVSKLENCSNNKERKLLLKDIRKHIEKESRQFPLCSFQQVPLPEFLPKKNLSKVFRSRNFLVQVFTPENGATRLSINRVTIKDDGSWHDGITWDELMWIKNTLGYSCFEAVEVYPREEDIVNVANIRHLFILEKPLAFSWRTDNT